MNVSLNNISDARVYLSLLPANKDDAGLVRCVGAETMWNFVELRQLGCDVIKKLIEEKTSDNVSFDF